MSATDRQQQALARQIGPVVSDLGFDVDDITVTRVGRRSLVCVTVDSDDGIDLDGIAAASHAISSALDADDPFDTPFVLEVSSPGIDRPLTDARHWRRNIGRLVETTVDGVALTGRIVDVDGTVVRLQPSAEAGGRVRDVPFASLGPGRVQVEFNRPDAVLPSADGSVDDPSTLDEEV